MRVRALNFPTPALNQTRSQHKAHLKVTQTHLTRASRPGGGNTRAKGGGEVRVGVSSFGVAVTR